MKNICEGARSSRSPVLSRILPRIWAHIIPEHLFSLADVFPYVLTGAKNLCNIKVKALEEFLTVRYLNRLQPSLFYKYVHIILLIEWSLLDYVRIVLVLKKFQV